MIHRRSFAARAAVLCRLALLSLTLLTTGLPAMSSTGLDFPSNGGAWNDVRFRFTGTSLPPMYPATYIWRVNHRQQAGYYATIFWGPDGAFDPDAYYGARPYPDGSTKSTSTSHSWSLAANGTDNTVDANGNPVSLGYGVW